MSTHTDEVERFFSIDAVTGQIYKTAELVNDTFGFSILLEVKAISYFYEKNRTVFYIKIVNNIVLC